jgi:Family of unknown function (DUF5990)
VRIRILGTQLPGRDCGPGGDFPGYSDIHVGVQRKNRRDELLDLHPGDADSAVWTLDCSVQGVGLRFRLFRRAKLMLEDVPADVRDSAATSGLLVGSLRLTDAKGNPLCARVRPPQISWTAG